MQQFVVLQAFGRKARKADLAQEKAVMVNDCVYAQQFHIT